MRSRSFVLLLLACGLASGCATRAADFKGPVGLQLYSLREQFKKDVPGTLDEVKQFGIKNVELASTYNLSPEQFRDELRKRGLEPVSAHYGFENIVTMLKV